MLGDLPRYDNYGIEIPRVAISIERGGNSPVSQENRNLIHGYNDARQKHERTYELPGTHTFYDLFPGLPQDRKFLAIKDMRIGQAASSGQLFETYLRHRGCYAPANAPTGPRAQRNASSRLSKSTNALRRQPQASPTSRQSSIFQQNTDQPAQAITRFDQPAQGQRTGSFGAPQQSPRPFTFEYPPQGPRSGSFTASPISPLSNTLTGTDPRQQTTRSGEFTFRSSQSLPSANSQFPMHYSPTGGPVNVVNNHRRQSIFAPSQPQPKPTEPATQQNRTSKPAQSRIPIPSRPGTNKLGEESANSSRRQN